MDKALQTALVTLAERRGREKEREGEGEEGGGDREREEGAEAVKWIQEFVSIALPGSRHQVLCTLILWLQYRRILHYMCVCVLV